MAEQFSLPPGATAVSPTDTQDTTGAATLQQFALPPGATPVEASTTPPTFGENVWSGVKQGAGDIWGQVKGMASDAALGAVSPAALAVKQAPAAAKTVWDNLPPVQLVRSVQQILPMIDAYERARSSGAPVADAITAVNDAAQKHISNIQPLAGVVKAFHDNPTQATARALTDATAAATSLLIPGAVERLLPEEAGAVTAAAEAEPVASKPGWFVNPFRQGSAVRRAFSPTTAAQPEAQATLREGALTSAADAGVTTPITNAPGAGIRTLMTQPIAEATKVEDGLYATVNKAAETDMKSLYDRREELQDALDDPTQIANRQSLQIELQTTQTRINWGEDNVRTKLGTEASDLIRKAKAATQQRYAMETGDAKLFNNESVVKGNVAHGGNETINVEPAIRQAELLDKPSKFAPRGSPTRLQQMFGVDGAKAFKQGLYDAQKAGQTVMARNKILGILVAGGGFYEWLKH